jgi:uncharacterized protein (TIGR00255 family)
MTGYGKSILQLPTKKITIEVKSRKQLERGKIDFSIYVEMTGEETTTQLNQPVVKQYLKQLKDVVNGDATELLKMAVRFPDALSTDRGEIDENEWAVILNEIKSALSKIDTYRLDEGKVLEADFRNRIATIGELLEQVIIMDPERIEGVRERLRRGLEELKEKVDENRFEQELIFYIEKFDITEEKVRLENHLKYFISSLDSVDSNGKKLGFIGQEIGREINTIGSKSNYAPMQKLVVQMKDELEKIKEQLLNVL